MKALFYTHDINHLNQSDDYEGVRSVWHRGDELG